MKLGEHPPGSAACISFDRHERLLGASNDRAGDQDETQGCNQLPQVTGQLTKGVPLMHRDCCSVSVAGQSRASLFGDCVKRQGDLILQHVIFVEIASRHAKWKDARP
ncbi:hypothetical protein [Bradyrhizobium denitrificans]|uniref:hypothetical protein n=1 Tax=Bradyrhizobium denitrificans TaxID=2734912 RepID=UPI00202357A9|nr:hypothetical protein [Bradyrhizobium denitrificans]MCL8484132.1 hypothetical protein [Bradyrhizobium denitrificans]